MFNGVHVFVDREELALLRAEHVRLYPAGREQYWRTVICGSPEWSPEYILEWEIEQGMKCYDLVVNFAEDYLNWDEVPKLAELPHLDEAWTEGRYEWSHLSSRFNKR